MNNSENNIGIRYCNLILKGGILKEMWKQINIDKSTILGNTDIGRISTPYLSAPIKRKNPDMSSSVPYYPSLSGKTLQITIEGTVATSYLITFTSDSYLQSLQDITTICTPDVKGTDSYGYLTLTLAYSGDRNSIRITGGTSLSILGFEAYPHPSAISYAGEIDSGKSTYYEGRVKGSTSFINNEPIQKDILNRFGAGISYVLDTFLANLDREIPIPRQYSVTISSNSFTINSPDRLYLSTNNIFTANPGADSLENAVTIIDQNNNLVFDSSGNRVRVTSITYGSLVDATSTFSIWNTADGKSIFGGLSHYQKTKSTRTITNIIGNTIKCSGATFITDKVQVNDVIVISGATNLIPFNHNGEFIVDTVISEEIIQVRPKGISDVALFPGNNLPSSLNVKLDIGNVYGTVTIPIGKFCPLAMKSGLMTFNLSASLTGTYKVILPIGTPLKTIVAGDLTQFQLPKENGGQIELGSKLITTLANALKPRIIAKPNQDTSKTYLLELKNGTIGCRIYSLLTGGIEIVYNGLWNGTTYVKDDNTKEIISMVIDGTKAQFGTATFNLNIDPINTVATLGDVDNQIQVDSVAGTIDATMINTFNIKDASVTVLSVPNFDGLITSQINSKPGIKLGTGFTTDTQHLIEKINYNCNTTSGKYTLLSETTLSGPKRREYTLDSGWEITTHNAKWNGTQWVKDDTAKYATKLVLSDRDTILYRNFSTTSPFNESAWTDWDNIKNYIIKEEFTCLTGVLSSNGVVGNFYFNNAANTTAQSGSVGSVVANQLGYAHMSSGGIGSFLGSLSSSVLMFGTRDFEMELKVSCDNKPILNGISIGYLVGNFAAGTTTDKLGIMAGSDETNWFFRIGTNSIDTGIPVVDDEYIEVKFSKLGSQLFSYINGTLLDTRNYTETQNSFQPTISISGVESSVVPTRIIKIDYFRLWIGNI